MTDPAHLMPRSFEGPEGQPDMPYLLTPGPLTTSRGVKLAMLADWGSRDLEFRRLVADIRTELLRLAGARGEHECVLMQGSGTFAIEAALGAFAPRSRVKKTLFLINGAYGRRAAEILKRIGGRPHEILETPEDQVPTPEKLRETLEADTRIEVVFIVHCETTSGIVNPLKGLSETAKTLGKTVIVDAMSSFGALPIDVAADGIDVLISSSNKCIEGVPGFSCVICRRSVLEQSDGRSHSLVLDLHDQWQAMERNGQFRFTPPTHALVAFFEALRELRAEGGPPARLLRYRRNKQALLENMRELGFETLLGDDHAGPIIQTFLTPRDPQFRFDTFYDGLKARGFAIYPGKVTARETFRIGTIGRLDETVMDAVSDAIREVLQEMGVTDLRPAA